MEQTSSEILQKQPSKYPLEPAYSAKWHPAEPGLPSLGHNCVSVQIDCPSRPVMMKNKQIILVVDKSGSMEPVIPALRSSLLAFRNAMLRIITGNVVLSGEPSSSKYERGLDRLFARLCDVKLITFDTTAELIWSSEKWGREKWVCDSEVRFSSAVNSIDYGNTTNMGQALEMAFDICQEKCTWIIVLTDGRSNELPCMQLEDFEKLLLRKPPKAQIITLGYGDDFDCEVLDSIGTFSYVKTPQNIAEVFAAISVEVATAYAIDAHLPTSQFLIGSSKIGTLFSERKYVAAFTCREKPGRIILQYTDIETGTQRVVIPLAKEENFESLSPYYYLHQKGVWFRAIYKAFFTACTMNETKLEIETEIAKWQHPSAQPHKAEILQLLEELETADPRRVLSRAVDSSRQGSYDDEMMISPMQSLAIESGRRDYSSYLR